MTRSVRPVGRLFGCTLIVLVVLCGCVSVAAIPERWPAAKVADGDGCPDLTGTYRNTGLDTKGEATTRLANLVFEEASANWTREDVATASRFRAATHVTIRGPDADGLRIEAWVGEEQVGSVMRERGLGDGFRCADGALTVDRPIYADSGGGIFFDAFRSVRLISATDGSLLAHTGSTGVGLGFYLVPLVGRFENWAIYRVHVPEAR